MIQFAPRTQDKYEVRGLGTCPARATMVQRGVPCAESCRTQTTISTEVSDGLNTYNTELRAAIAQPSPPTGCFHFVSIVSHSDSAKSKPYKSLYTTTSCPG